MNSSTDPNRTKKSKGRYVPSRFMQSAEKYSHSSDETLSGPDKFYITRNPSPFCGTLLDKTTANQTTSKKTHSTPEIAGVSPPNFDESAIPNASCTIRDFSKTDRLKQKALNSSAPKVPSIKRSTQKNTSNIVPSHCIGKKTKSSLNQELENFEAESDISYAQYQLNLLLENKARKSLYDKSKLALEKIYEVFSFIQVLLGKHENIKKSLNVVSFLLKLHEHLHKQEKMLAPALEKFDLLETHYEEISTAVDCVRHKLLVEEVMSPEGSEGEIIQLLDNIINFLNVILTSVGNVDAIVSSADVASAFVKKGELTSQEMKRGLELLAEARALLLDEASLKLISFYSEN